MIENLKTRDGQHIHAIWSDGSVEVWSNPRGIYSNEKNTTGAVVYGPGRKAIERAEGRA